MNSNSISQKALSFLLCFTMILSVFGVDTAGAFAAVNDSGTMRNGAPVTLYLDSGDIVITENGYSVGGGDEVLCTGGYVITQNGSGDVSHTITVKSGTQDITLQDVHAKSAHGAAFEIESGAEADITLVGSNSLDSSGSSDFCAGLSVNADSAVRISGTGSLTAYGQLLYAAGIGGNYNQSCGTVEISGGTVEAHSGTNAAGIGGGYSGSGGTIKITGGTVTAYGGTNGVGIGGGMDGSGGTITISGGTVTAKADPNGDADIGNGHNGGKNCSLAVSGGATVTMQSGLGTDASPFTHKDCTIIIGGTTTKYDADGHAIEIRTLYLDNGDIVITKNGYSVGGGNEVAYRGRYKITHSDAVKDSDKVKHSITVESGTQDITLQDAHAKPTHGAAFEIESGAEADITLAGSNSLDTSESSSKRAGLAVNDGGTVCISGSGFLTATGKMNSAGIGGNGENSCGTVTVSGGTVTATGGSDGAGIGGGLNGSGGTVTVSGGTVTANGGYNGAGIGGGYNGKGGTVTVSGGTVTATGGSGGAGIGGGKYFTNGGAGGTVTISGADTQVTAKGQDGEDIGSGEKNDSGGSLTVGDVSIVDGPAVKLLSAGTNASNPDDSRPQFMNCVIHGAGAKDASGNDLSGCYDANGKIRLEVTIPTLASAKIGETVTLSASVTKHNPDVQKYQFNSASLPGTVQFTGNGTSLGSPVGVTNGTAQISWTPANGNKVSLKAAYVPATDDRYAPAESAPIDYTPGKITPAIQTAPTASPVKAGEKLSASVLTGGVAAANGKQISGTFAWAHPDTAVAGSGNYEVIFTPTDTADYNTVGGILVAVTVSGGKITPAIQTAPTASPVKAGEKLSASVLTGGVAAANGKQISGAFSWAHPDMTVTASGSYEVIFTPTDTADYNTVGGIPVAVTVAAAPSSGSHGTPYPVNLTLDGVNIDVSNVTDPLSKTNDISNTAKHCALCLSDLTVGNDYPAVNLTLKDSNYLKSGSYFAGLQVDGKQTLKIDGSGRLTATGGLGGAGIGGGAHVDTVFQDYGFGCGTIGIHGGTVTAVGGDTGTVNQVTVYGGAGIGGGADFPGVTDGTISISGGTVTANGNGGSAGIGGGAGTTGGSGGTVSITGGTVTANGSTALVNSGGSYTLLRSAGIGGAGGSVTTGGSGGTITISGGTVTAKSSGAAMVKLPNAPENDNFGNYGLQYGGSFSQGGQTYHIYYKYIDGFGYLYHATWENGSMDHILQVPTDGAAIGSGGIPYSNMRKSEYSSHTDSGDGGTIEISGGTVTAESTETTDNVLGGADIGNSEASYYYKMGCSHYTLMGSCRFTGGSINTHLTGNFAASPAPTDGNGNPVYKTTATLPDIHTPTAVTVTLASGGGFSAQTDEKGGLYLWLPETGSSDTVQYNVTINGADISYELKGTVKTDGSSQLTPYRTDASLENLSFGGQQASPTSTPGTYQVNVGSSTKIITIQELTTSDLYSFSVNSMVGSATRSVVVEVQELETDLSVFVAAKGGAEKHYTVRVMRAARNNTALTGLAINDRAWIPDADGAYRFIVENSMTAAKVRAVPLDPNASYTIQANGKTLTPGADGAEVALGDMGSTTDISIVVRAEDGTTQKTYHLFLFRSGSRLSDLISVLSPSGAAISGFNITASVGSGTASIPVDVTVSKGAVWGLYSDPACTQAIANNTMTLGTGANTAYLKILSQDGVGLSIYTLTVTRASNPSSSHGSSHGTSAPSLPSSLTDATTHITVDLSGVTFPSWVTGVSLSATPETASGAPTGTPGGAADPQGAAAYRYAVSDQALSVIGTPLLLNIRLLDRSGNPVSFTGSATVRIPLPADLRGTPRVFRYESNGTLTDMNAAVENGFLVFQTTHFSYYVVAGTGNSITLDTKNYQMPVGGKYQIGVKLTGSKAMTVKVYSTSDKTATVAKLKNGNYQVTGNGLGTAYIMFDVYDNKNKLLTHASVRVDVKTGIRPRGDSMRQIGMF
ncbi:hypothetical protein A7X67_02825 [Clostridium sp. W14A]|nr:hypothetical protein A7X67_02825 [Clostridium sp. W14A]